MKKFFAGMVLSLLPTIAVGADGVIAPPWAYPAADPAAVANRPPEPVDTSVKHVPGSTKELTLAQVTSAFGQEDWFPDEHPPMPEVVKDGRRPAVRACGTCHLPNGLGHPESADIADMPADYLFQQMKDFQSGKRHPIYPDRSIMGTIAMAMNDDEIKSAADYFASLKPVPGWVKFVETKTVPVTYVGVGSMRFVKEDGGIEPLGERIIEVPENKELVDLRDTHSGFIAYVPVGSIKKGEQLATTGGNGKTLQCAICHGPELKGLGNIPRIAGDHPVYIIRQLLDIKQGARDTTATQLMKGVVANLTLDDMVNIAAYVSSRAP